MGGLMDGMHATIAEIATAENITGSQIGRTVLSDLAGTGYRRGDLWRRADGKAAGQETAEAVSGDWQGQRTGMLDPN